MTALLVVCASVAAALLLRRLLCNHPVAFDVDGTRYLRLPDGSFRHADGTPVSDPTTLACVDWVGSDLLRARPDAHTQAS